MSQMEGTGGPASGSVLTLLVREGVREGNSAILTDREEAAKGSTPPGPRRGSEITSLMSAQEVAFRLEGRGKQRK